jgi:hypothetical protein
MMHRLGMRRLIATLLAAAWVAAGCAALPGGGATSQELRGPWRPQPLSVDRATIDASQQACRAQEAEFGVQGPATTGQLVAVDGRGGGRITLLYVGRGESYLQCQVDLGSSALAMGGSSSEPGPQRVVAANDLLILGSGGTSGGAKSSSSVVGRVGSDVTAVRIVLPSGSSLQATIGGGWFTAWWPTDEMTFVAEAFNASGQKVGEATH